MTNRTPDSIDPSHEWMSTLMRWPEEWVRPLAAVLSDELVATQNDLLVAIAEIRRLKAEQP